MCIQLQRVLCIFAVLVSATFQAGSLSGDDRPNILLITADDMNWDSLGCYGNNLSGVTPNLDQLAKEGVRFQHAYVTIAICQPCRASIMTGRYPHRSGALGFDKIRPDVPTLTELLRQAGYYTACIGKAVHTVPSRHNTGFDETYNMQQLGFGRSEKRYSEVTAAAIAQAVAKQQPFFLNVNTHDPHRPFANSRQEQREKKPKRWQGVPLVENPYQPNEVTVPKFLPDLPAIRKEIAEYYTSVRRCDQIIGGVLSVLEQSGQAENTLVLFLSDHGMATPFAKTNCWMHSNRTPFIVRWPGKANKDQIVSDKMISSIDIAPTILDCLGLTVLEGADGKSFRSLIDDRVQNAEVGREQIFVHLNYPFSRKPFPMRGVITMQHGYIWNGWADGETKFSNESMSGRTFAAMKKQAKNESSIAERVKHYLYRCPEEVYDYSVDPDALNNRIDHPEQQEVLNGLRQAVLEHLRRTNDPALESFEAYLKSNGSKSEEIKE